jgi:hypothetical protein
MAKLRVAINMLNEQVGSFPVGSEIWNALTGAIKSLSAKIPSTAEVPGVQQTALRDTMQNANKNEMLQQVMSSLGAGGAQSGAAGPVAGSPAPSPQGVM